MIQELLGGGHPTTYGARETDHGNLLVAMFIRDVRVLSFTARVVPTGHAYNRHSAAHVMIGEDHQQRHAQPQAPATR